MTDIFDEVEEDLRRERIRRLWDRFGIFVIGGAVLIVLVVAGWRGYVAWETARERAAGDRYVAALEDARAGAGGAGAAALEGIAEGGPAGYRLLARFRLASERAEAGDFEAAVAGFRAIAADGGVDDLYRDLARVRAGHVLLDAGDPRGAAGEVAALAERQGGAFANAAKEVMGLAAFAEGNMDEARRWFADLESDPAAPQGLRGRSRLMLALLDGRAPAEADEPAPATDPSEATQ